jgi:hypothetical protein
MKKQLAVNHKPCMITKLTKFKESEASLNCPQDINLLKQG